MNKKTSFVLFFSLGFATSCILFFAYWHAASNAFQLYDFSCGDIRQEFHKCTVERDSLLLILENKKYAR